MASPTDLAVLTFRRCCNDPACPHQGAPCGSQTVLDRPPFERDFAYSRAVVQGPWCFVSGVTGYDYAAMVLPEGVVAQAQACFETISGVLTEADFTLAHVVRVQYTLPERAYISEIQPVLQTWLGAVRPAATMVIADLIDPAMLIEIEVTALRA
ncbi:MAG: RidA family protein [Pseudomonadota bacterium]